MNGDQYISMPLAKLAIVLSLVFMAATFMFAPDIFAYNGPGSSVLNAQEDQALSQAVANFASGPGDSQVVLDSVQTSVKLFKHKRVKNYSWRISPQRCSLIKQSMRFQGKPYIWNCRARFRVTSIWYTRGFAHSASLVVHPNVPGPRCGEMIQSTIVVEVFMFAWKVTIEGFGAAENRCDRVMWLDVTCNVNWSIGWDINITRCGASPAMNERHFYKDTWITAQIKSNFISAILPIQFSYCYMAGMDPNNHLVYNLHNC